MIFSVNYFYAAEIAKQLDSTRIYFCGLGSLGSAVSPVVSVPGGGEVCGGKLGLQVRGSGGGSCAESRCAAQLSSSWATVSPGRNTTSASWSRGPALGAWRGRSTEPARPDTTLATEPMLLRGNIYSFYLVHVRCHGNQITIIESLTSWLQYMLLIVMTFDLPFNRTIYIYLSPCS